MEKRKIAAALCLAAALLAVAPALARGGRAGGRMGGASITRTAPRAVPSPARPAQQARPQQPAGNAGQAGQRAADRPIDQGIDPKDYGKRSTSGNAGSAGGSTQRPGQTAPAQNNFTGGGGGFFNGFSLWPWLWFAGHGSSGASDGTDNAEAEEQEPESLSVMLGRWWDNVISFFQSLFSF